MYYVYTLNYILVFLAYHLFDPENLLFLVYDEVSINTICVCDFFLLKANCGLIFTPIFPRSSFLVTSKLPRFHTHKAFDLSKILVELFFLIEGKSQGV